jgi:hypothetical protein
MKCNVGVSTLALAFIILANCGSPVKREAKNIHDSMNALVGQTEDVVLAVLGEPVARYKYDPAGVDATSGWLKAPVDEILVFREDITTPGRYIPPPSPLPVPAPRPPVQPVYGSATVTYDPTTNTATITPHQTNTLTQAVENAPNPMTSYAQGYNAAIAGRQGIVVPPGHIILLKKIAMKNGKAVAWKTEPFRG